MKRFGKASHKFLTKIIVIGLPLGLLFSFGCSSGQIKYISLVATKDLNKGGNACYVCIYQLRNDLDFKRTPIESFWQEGEKPFEADVVDDIICETLIPEDEALIDIDISEETNFIGVAADFRSPDKENWKQVFEIPSSRPEEIQIVVGYDSVRIDEY